MGNFESIMSPMGKSLVVGAPRTGFALLLNILGELGRPAYDVDSQIQRAVNILTPLLGDYLYLNVLKILRGKYADRDIIYNQTFRPLLGGPFWLDEENKTQACVRKYVGVKDVGDFTLVVYLPKATLHYHDRVHSHYFPARWPDEAEFSHYTRFASMRNPLGALYSAAFSINAITGEYIDRFIGDEGDLRQKFAQFRLSDIKMVDGLITHAGNYLKDFSLVSDRYNVFRWEDIIQHPAQTIVEISRCCENEISLTEAQKLWDRIAYKNLTGKHRYNFRRNKGHGVVDDWKYFLCNEHLELFKQHHIDEFLCEFGYAPITYFDEKDYSPFQRKVSHAIRQGEVLTEGLKDRNLQIFNWNKSNIVKTDHAFVRYPRKNFSCVERANFSDHEILDEFSEHIEDVMGRVNQFIDMIYATDEAETEQAWRDAMNHIKGRYQSMFNEMNSTELMDLYEQRFSLLFDVLGECES